MRHAVDQTTVEVPVDALLQRLAVRPGERHPSALVQGQRFNHRLGVHLDAVNALGGQLSVVFIVERRDPVRRNQANHLAPPLKIDVRFVLQHAHTEGARSLNNVVSGQRIAVDATPVADERVPDEEAPDLEVALRELDHGGEITVELGVGGEGGEPCFAGRHTAGGLPSVVEDEVTRFNTTLRERGESAFHAVRVDVVVKGVPRAPAEQVDEVRHRFGGAQRQGTELRGHRASTRFH